MTVRNLDRWWVRTPAVAWALAAALLLACASAPQATAPAATQAVEAAVSDVRVTSEGGTTRVTLVGPMDPVYTAFQQEDPPRIVVDLVGAVTNGVPEATAVYDGRVEEVAVTPFALGTGEPRTRVEISLAEASAYDVGVTTEGLELRIGADVVGANTLLEGDAYDATDTSMESLPAAQDETIEVSDTHEVATEGRSGTTLLEVASTSDEAGTRIHLIADGEVADAEHFVLDSPHRLVIDLPGMVTKTGAGSFGVNGEGADRVRIGQHADKVRVVIDADAGFDGFAGARLSSTFDGLVVSFGGTPTEALAATDEPEPMPAALDESPAELPAEAPTFEVAEPASDEERFEAMIEPAAAEPELEIVEESAAAMAEVIEPAASTVQVYGVQFDDENGAERLVVLSDAPLDWRLGTPDAGTLMVRLPGATIDPDAAVRIAPEPAGTVSLVTAFQQPEMATPEVRLVVRRAPGAEPEVTQQGSMLIFDFPKSLAQAPVLPAPAPQAAPSTASTKAMAATAAAAIPAPVPAAIADVEPVEILEEGGLIDGKDYTGRRISLDFKDVDIADVLRLIAEVSDLNIIAGDEVQGEVTIRLVDVPWDQALDVILLTKGLGFVRVGNVLRIAPSDLLKAEEEARLQEKRAKEKLEDLVVKLQPVNYAAVSEISKMVERLLTPRGTVDVDQRTNTLILKDIKSVIDEATALIKAIDTQTPQVLIEAKIVEANLDFSRELGSTWAFGTQPLEDGFNGDSSERRDLGGGDFVFHDNPLLLNGITETFNHVQVANPITSVANGLLDLGAFILDDKFNVELRLEAAESNGEGKVISSPRVVTLDNRKAKIEQGVSIPFQTFENGDAKLEFIDAVLKLEVTPHITADRSIIMDISIQRNAPDDSVQTPTGSPAIAKNEAETETLIKDGQTLVIGGIYVVRKSDRQSRVPYFHRIPLIGNAFRNNEVRDIRQELLVFVTPRIVVNPELGS